MLLSGWWNWWAPLAVITTAASQALAELQWPQVQPITANHLESFQPSPDSPQSSRTDSERNSVLSQPLLYSIGFPERTGESAEVVEEVEERVGSEGVEGEGGRSPRFISKFKEWYKGKDKEVVDDNDDDYHIVISNSATNFHFSDHHSSQHSGGHGGGYGHGPGYGYSHSHGHDYYGHGHGYGLGYGHGHGPYGHSYYDHCHGYGPYGYYCHGSHEGYPGIYEYHHSYLSPRPLPPYYHYPLQHHHHSQQHHQPVVQPIIIDSGGKGSGKGRDKGKIVILSNINTQPLNQGNFGAYNIIHS